MTRAAICGTGLVGASIGLGLRHAGWTVTGWDTDPEALDTAVRRGAVEPADGLVSLTNSSPDLLVLGTPPVVTKELVATLEHPGLVIDVAGVKTPIVSAARLPRFVATHPMAGREVSGPEAASDALFRGAMWVVVPGDAAAEDVEFVASAIRLLGARPIEMSAREHDELVAMVSHLPQLLAASLVTHATDADGALELAAGSFRDLTRVASSDPRLWVEVLRENRDAVEASLRGLMARLSEFAAALADDHPDRLAGLLAHARDARRSLAARVTDVRVALADRPGELAKVGHALQESGVDVRDIQLRHAPHGGGGVLTVSVRPGDGDRLRAALEKEGLLIAD